MLPNPGNRTLVATEFPPDAPGGGPSVVRQMLEGYQGELFWWSCRPPATRAGGSNLRAATLSGHSWAGLPGRIVPHRRLAALKSWVMERCWAPLAAAHLSRTLGTVRPDCVWVIPHDWSILPLAQALLPRRDIRWHTTIQDYPDAHRHGQTWGTRRVERMVHLQERLYALAASRDATSLPMLEDLKQRTGASGAQMMHQGLEEVDFAFLRDLDQSSSGGLSASPPSGPVRIGYAGTILVEREFAAFATALERIRDRDGVDVTLDFWGAHSYRDRPWFREKWMKEHGNLDEASLLAALRKCHWGFAPMAMDDLDPRYNRFSFPTKFITYLAAGLPVLCMGHPDASVMKMLQSFAVGPRVSEGEPTATGGSWVAAVDEERLAEALRNPLPRSTYLPEILRCASTHFDACRMRTTLFQCLRG